MEKHFELSMSLKLNISNIFVIVFSFQLYSVLSFKVFSNKVLPQISRLYDGLFIGSSVISVDSTIGFPDSGALLTGENVIFYTDKSVNQFLNCTNIESQINCSDDIRTDQYIFGYEDGDLDKLVKMRITGVISDLDRSKNTYGLNTNDFFGVRNVGEIIPNKNENKKQILANSWIYNTSSRYQVSSLIGSSFKLKSLIDKSSLCKTFEN